MLLSAGTVVTDSEVLSPGWVETDGPVVVGVGGGPGRAGRPLDLPASTVVPGFVDAHVHGGGGGSFDATAAAGVMRGVLHHRAHGTTTTLTSLVTAGLDELKASIRLLATLVADGEIAGIHLEGPWLSAGRCGAHDPRLLRHPSAADVDDLLAAAPGAVRMVTLAPELPGGLDAVAAVVRAGAVAAVGHTDADHATTVAAIDAGATMATHLFNAMPGLHHRDPGPVAALLLDPRVTVELIGDGLHLAPAMIALVEQVAGTGRIALVTDATAASGMPDGRFTLGTLAVDVRDGAARVVGTDTIAGGTATMDALFRAAVARLGGGHADPGALVRAVRMTSLNPATALGLGDVGRLATGCSADLVVLDELLAVQGVQRRGAWVRSP